MLGTLLTVVAIGVLGGFMCGLMGGKDMAGRSGSTVINIIINESDGEVFDILGRGLHGVQETFPIIKREIEAKLGDGLKFDNNDAISVNTGDGLAIDDEGKINVSVGEGLSVDKDGNIVVTAKYSDVIGSGLTVTADGKVAVADGEGIVMNDGKVNVNLGDGLKIDGDGRITMDTGEGIVLDQDGKITAERAALGDGLAYDNQDRLIIDNSVPGPTEMFQAVSDIKLGFDLGVLTLTKIITTYTVSKSKVGTVVGVTPLSNRIEYEQATIGGGPYSYGMGMAMHSVPDRKADPKAPMFYKV